ncbi:MAG TPA: histidine kinase N-terminal 7TM domain-containing protein [Anaerolineae bacterium]|nr:histidine kinase N-terminal 7TM domain-containing protein [Anaerolineae bacterium]
MHQETIYIIVLICSALVSGGIALYAWQQRQMPTATSCGLMMLGVAIWLLGYAFELANTELTPMLWGTKVGYLGVATAPTLWLVFAIQYTGRERWLTRRRILALFTVPSLIILLVWTNEWHHLYYPKYWVDTTGAFPMLANTRGATYLGGAVYAYLVLLSATVLLVRAWIRASGTYRRQINIILSGAIFPWAANFLYLTRFNPFPDLNITPLSFTLTGLVMAWGLFRYRLLDVIPIARDKVVESMRDGVIVLDAQARIVDLNPAAQALLGAPLADVIAQPVAHVLSGQLNVLQNPLNAPETPTQIVLGSPPTQQYYDLYVSPLYNRRQQLTGWVVVLHDVTQRKRAELALQERTSELEVRNAELDAFAHTVAHDLKSPLTIIMGFTQMTVTQLKPLLTAEHLENMQRIVKTSKKMATIIDELLLLASVREVQQMTMAPLEMEAIVAEALDRLRNEITDAQADIRVPTTWPVAMGYAPWVEEIWVNYISNAIKYGGQPEKAVPPQVTLGASPPAPPIVPNQDAAQIIFWVRDTGPGLTDEQCEKLFTPFTRLHVRAPGHGLGLSIVRRIIERLGGAVGVVSEPGQGSTFYFTLRAPNP